MVAPHRSISMNVLYNNAKSVWPGMEIGWIGDLTHQGEVSGHNPDDYPPLQAEQVDADNDPEVRALDFMIGSHFTPTDADKLTHALATGVDRNRLYYVIYDGLIYKRSNNYQPVPYTGTDPHTNHVHASGRAVDDANSSNWTSVLALGVDMTEWNDSEKNSVVSRVGGMFLATPQVTWKKTDGTTATESNALLALFAALDDKLDQIIQGQGGGGVTPPSFTVDDIRQVVREELDKTKFSAAP